MLFKQTRRRRPRGPYVRRTFYREDGSIANIRINYYRHGVRLPCGIIFFNTICTTQRLKNSGTRIRSLELRIPSRNFPIFNKQWKMRNAESSGLA